jgi:hypothetical protein
VAGAQRAAPHMGYEHSGNFRIPDVSIVSARGVPSMNAVPVSVPALHARGFRVKGEEVNSDLTKPG